MTDIIGIDVSHHQGSIDWPRVHVGFVYVKATEGTGNVDPKFAANRMGAARQHIPFGCYHYGHPADSPDAEVDHFLRVAGDDLGQLPPCIDLEVAEGRNPAALQSWCSRFVARLQTETGRRPTLYTGASFFSHELGGHDFGAYRWIARYNANPPTVPFDIWQNSSSGAITGIGGHVDTNRCAPAAFARMIGHPAPAPQPSTKGPQRMFLCHPAGANGVYLVTIVPGDKISSVGIEDPTDRDAFIAAGVPLIEVSADTWNRWRG